MSVSSQILISWVKSLGLKENSGSLCAATTRGTLIAGSRDSTLGADITLASHRPEVPTKALLFLPMKMGSPPKLVGYRCPAGAWPLHQGTTQCVVPQLGTSFSRATTMYWP